MTKRRLELTVSEWADLLMLADRGFNDDGDGRHYSYDDLARKGDADGAEKRDLLEKLEKFVTKGPSA